MISSKWNRAKIGCLVMESLTTKTLEPRLFRFVGFEERPKPADRGWWNPNGVKLQDVVTHEFVVVDADDRYGHYPIVDNRRIEDMSDQAEALEEELGKYRHILDLIEKYADLRI